MEKKYELLKDDYIDIDGQRVYRIRALKDFRFDPNDPDHHYPGVRKGMLGGYIQSEGNLSHEGDCWIGDPGAAEDTIVYGSSRVEGDGMVRGKIRVKDSHITGFVDGSRSVIEGSKVLDSAWIHNFRDGKVIGSHISGNADIRYGGEIIHSVIADDANIEGGLGLEIRDSELKDKSSVVVAGPYQPPKLANTFLSGRAMVREGAVVLNSTISGNGAVAGKAEVRDSYIDNYAGIGACAKVNDSIVIGKALVYGDARILRSKLQDQVRVYMDAVVEQSVVAGDARISGNAAVRNFKFEGIVFTKSVNKGIHDAEQMALSADPPPEKSRSGETCYIAPAMKHRTITEDGRHVPSYVVYTKQKNNSRAGYKENILAFFDTLEEAKRGAGENGYTDIVVENPEKKYEMAMDEASCVMFGKRHYRIRALKDIPEQGIPAGRIGGYVESEANLSHDGNCWVAHDALVSGNALVEGDAVVCGRATVMDDAVIKGKSMVSSFVTVGGNAIIGDHAHIMSSAIVMDDAKVLGHAHVSGDAVVCGTSLIGDATVRDNAIVMDSKAWGGAVISGHAVMIHNARADNNAKLGGYDLLEGNLPVRQQNEAERKMFGGRRLSSQKKVYTKKTDREKQKIPNLKR